MSSFSAARFPTLPLAQNVSHSEPTAPQGNPVLDEELLRQIQEGDQEALGRLFERHVRVARNIAIRILRDTTEAEDLVQDLFLFLQRKCNLFDNAKSSARSWIIQMAYHRAIERRRHLAHRRFYSQVELEHHAAPLVGTPTTEADYSAEAVFGRNGLDGILEALTENQLETLRLHFFDGYTLAEVAQKLNQPLGNVRHYYYRSLEKLRKQMVGNVARAGGGHEK